MRLTTLTPDGAVIGTATTPFIGGSATSFFRSGIAMLAVSRDLQASVAWTDDLLRLPEPLWRDLDVSELVGPEPANGERVPPVMTAGQSGRIYLGWGHGEYSIHVGDTAGIQIGMLERRLDPPLRDAGDVEKIRARGRRRAAVIGSAASEAESEIHASHPHFRSFHEDPCGRLWVATYRGGDDGTVVDLFSEGGDFIGAITLPLAGSLHDVSVDRVYLILKSELGVPGIAVMRLGAWACP